MLQDIRPFSSRTWNELSDQNRTLTTGANRTLTLRQESKPKWCAYYHQNLNNLLRWLTLMGDILIQKPHDISQFEYSVVKEVCGQYPQTACLDGGGKIMDGSARRKKIWSTYMTWLVIHVLFLWRGTLCSGYSRSKIKSRLQ